MINENSAKAYCCEDISLIENYEKAIADKKTTWHCHHRGEVLPCGRYTPEDLKKFNLYYSRPAAELIFLTPNDHMSLHHKGQAHRKGQHLSEETKKKMSEARKGKPISALKGLMWWNNGVKTIRAFQCPGPEWHRGRC